MAGSANLTTRDPSNRKTLQGSQAINSLRSDTSDVELRCSATLQIDRNQVSWNQTKPTCAVDLPTVLFQYQLPMPQYHTSEPAYLCGSIFCHYPISPIIFTILLVAMPQIQYTVLLLAAYLCLAHSGEVTLNRYSGTKSEDKLLYTVPVSYGKQTFKLKVDLNAEKSWIKSSGCKTCANLQCKQSCSGKLGPAKQGLKCQQPSCTQSSSDYNENNVEGKEAQIEVAIGKQFNKTLPMVLVDKVKLNIDNFTRQYDGVLNLLQEPEVFEEFTLVMKDKKLYLGINQQLAEQDVDPKDQPLNETLESDGGIQVKSVQFGDQEVSAGSKAYLQLDTKSLHLPEQEFSSLKQKIGKINSQCSLESGVLKCSESSDISKMKDVLVGISFGTNKLELQFSAFVDTCKSKECQVFIKESEEEKIILGEVVLLAFGVHIHASDKVVTFHRLKNALSKKYHELAPSKSSTSGSTGQSGSFFSYVGHLFLFFFKLMIVLGILSLCINLYYNKARVVDWIRSKTQREQSHYTPAFAQDIENAGVLQGYDPKNASKEFWQQNTVDGI